MANVFDPAIQEVATPGNIEQPIGYGNLARNIGAGAQLLAEVGRRGAIEDLTGSGRTAKEVDASQPLYDANATEGEREAAVSSINTLSDLAAARKAGLPIGQARTRATAILKRALNSNPLYADDIRKAYNQFFGGTGAGSIFELTAEEKAADKYRGDITTRSLELGISPEAAAKSIRKEKANELQKSEYEVQAKERALNGDGYVNYANINTGAQVGKIMDETIAQVRSWGSLKPETVQSIKGRLRSLGAKLKREQTALLRDENGGLILDMVDRGSVDAANALIDKQIDAAIALLDDQAALKLASDNYNIVNDTFNTAVIENFGSFKAVKDALGEQGSQLYFQKLMGNEPFNVVAQHDPFVRSVLAAGENFKASYQGATGQAMGAVVNPSTPITPVIKAGWLGLMQSDAKTPAISKFAEAGGQERVNQLTMDSVVESPNSISLFKTVSWQNRIKSDPAYAEAAKAGMEGWGKAIKRNMVAELNTFDVSGVDISFSTEMPRYAAERGLSRDTLKISGDIGDATKDKIKTAYEVAERNPTLWQGEFESSLDYVKSLVGIRPATEPSGESSILSDFNTMSKEEFIDTYLRDPATRAKALNILKGDR